MHWGTKRKTNLWIHLLQLTMTMVNLLTLTVHRGCKAFQKVIVI